MIAAAPPARQGRPSTRGRDVGSRVEHPDARLAVAVEIGLARRVMREMGYSQADVEDEVARIRRRHARAA